MVKNTKGGSGHKSQARKHTGTISGKTRLSEDPSEMYAYVVTHMGGSLCQVVCHDGKTRLCVIRGKFRGTRGKRDSFITSSSWLLVGIRDWESSSGNNESGKCDLLEVYTEADKMKLRNVPGIDWGAFVRNDSINTRNDSSKVDEDIVFADTVDAEDYNRLIQTNSGGKSLQIISEKEKENEEEEEEEEINIDDI
jgi:hypothetical protein